MHVRAGGGGFETHMRNVLMSNVSIAMYSLRLSGIRRNDWVPPHTLLSQPILDIVYHISITDK